jgi:acyl carrier protein
MTLFIRKTDDNIKQRLKVFIREKFLIRYKDAALDENDSFLEKGIIDSTGVLELVNYIEDTFSIKIEDEELIPDNLDSLNKLEIFIKKKIGYVSK